MIGHHSAWMRHLRPFDGETHSHNAKRIAAYELRNKGCDRAT